MAGFKFTRDTYKSVKHMDRVQMERYFNDVYDNGYNNGIHKASNEVAARVNAALRKTTSLSDELKSELTDNINKELQSKYDIVDTHTVKGITYNIYSVNNDEHFEAYTRDGEFVMSGDTRSELYHDLDEI